MSEEGRQPDQVTGLFAQVEPGKGVAQRVGARGGGDELTWRQVADQPVQQLPDGRRTEAVPFLAAPKRCAADAALPAGPGCSDGGERGRRPQGRRDTGDHSTMKKGV